MNSDMMHYDIAWQKNQVPKATSQVAAKHFLGLPYQENEVVEVCIGNEP